MASEASVVLAPDLTSVRLARRFVGEVCDAAGVDDDTRAAVVLLTSETVTNAFTHGRSEARLSVRASARSVRVEVGDDNSRHPCLQPDDAEALDGRGVRILAEVATRWGVRVDEVGKVVWFEVDA